MSTSLTVTTERLDDLVLLLHVMMRLHLPAIVDRHLPRHWLHQGLDWGWVATIWLDHILSQGDHRKLTVRDWVCQARYTLQRTTGLLIRATSFADDRLTIVLRELSQPTYWHAIEQDLAQQTIRVYHLTPRRVRVDAHHRLRLSRWLPRRLVPVRPLQRRPGLAPSQGHARPSRRSCAPTGWRGC
jgi:transposase